MKFIESAEFYAIIAVILWATVASAFKIALIEMDFVNLLIWSSIWSLLAISIFALPRVIDSFKISNKKEISKALILGLLNPVLYYLFLLKAYSILPAQQALTLNYSWTLFVSIFGFIFLKHKITKFNVLFLLLGFSGIMVISIQGISSIEANSSSILGSSLALFSGVIWAGYWTFNSKSKIPTEVNLMLNFLSGSIILVLYGVISGTFVIPNVKGLFSTIYIGCFEMGITFLLWLRATKLTNNVSKIANLAFISPVLSLIIINFVLGESITINTIVGLFVIIISIILQVRHEEWLLQKKVIR